VHLLVSSSIQCHPEQCWFGMSHCKQRPTLCQAISHLVHTIWQATVKHMAAWPLHTVTCGDKHTCIPHHPGSWYQTPCWEDNGVSLMGHMEVALYWKTAKHSKQYFSFTPTYAYPQRPYS
jgi:hypothetical protein